jgi:hypothetical protein
MQTQASKLVDDKQAHSATSKVIIVKNLPTVKNGENIKMQSKFKGRILDDLPTHLNFFALIA